MQDVSLYVPFEDTQGFRTPFTLVEPTSNLAAQVRLTYLSPAGDVLLIDSLIMKPGEQITLILPDTYPDLAQKVGNVIVESNIDRFSAVALRYSDATGAIFAAPAINGPGALQ